MGLEGPSPSFKDRNKNLEADGHGGGMGKQEMMAQS